MTLAPGNKLGPYEILAPLGAGGMGEVWRARDPRLGREVAVKVLPESLARDPERVARFEREARSASTLSHAHVVTVFDFGRSDEIVYFVTEIVPGGNLRSLLDRGPMPVRRALELGGQIAAGLAAAHERGIVHRDLKPENVLLTESGDAKIADFGLAKLTDADAGDSQLPTSDGLKTAEGIVMGTAAYMSPEQARGAAVDFRSDQFAFGTILYEMLAGRSPFRGASTPETLSAIIRDEPPALRTAVPSLPASVVWLVERCLEKDPANRYAATRDLAREIALLREHLSDISAAPGPAAATAVAAPVPRRGPSVLRALGIAALVAAAAAAGAFLRHPRAEAPRSVVRFALPPPPGVKYSTRFDAVGFALSPDGSRLAFIGEGSAAARPVAPSASESRIWIRPLADIEARPVPGTEGATSVFWSDDGGSIGFFDEGRLKRAELTGGGAAPICDVPGAGRFSGTWAGHNILFCSTFTGEIFRVPADGSAPPERIVRPDSSRGETRASWPLFLPGGEQFLYVLVRKDGNSRLMVGSLDGRPSRDAGPIASRVEYADPGFLIFARDGALFAQGFDRSTARLFGPLRPVAPFVYYFFTSKWAGFSASRGGSIAVEPKGNLTRLAWYDRNGRVLQEIGPADAGETISLSISPDGRTALFDRTRTDLGTFDVWMLDLDRGTETRLTSDPNTEFDPVWLRDGKTIVYSVVQDYLPRLVRRDLGGAAEQPLLPGGSFQEAMDVSTDGKRLLFSQSSPDGSWGIWSLPLTGGGGPEPVTAAPKSMQELGRYSPDSRCIVYTSDESGAQEAYVREIVGGAKARLSTGGAQLIRWSRDGREIYFTSNDGKLMAVPVSTSPALSVGKPAVLFALPEAGWSAFDVAADGRFLAAIRTFSFSTAPFTIAVNATSELAR